MSSASCVALSKTIFVSLSLLSISRRLADFRSFRLDRCRLVRRGETLANCLLEKDANLPRSVGLARLKVGRLNLGDMDFKGSTSVVCRYKVIHYDRVSGQRGWILERKIMMEGCEAVRDH